MSREADRSPQYSDSQDCYDDPSWAQNDEFILNDSPENLHHIPVPEYSSAPGIAMPEPTQMGAQQGMAGHMARFMDMQEFPTQSSSSMQPQIPPNYSTSMQPQMPGAFSPPTFEVYPGGTLARGSTAPGSSMSDSCPYNNDYIGIGFDSVDTSGEDEIPDNSQSAERQQEADLLLRLKDEENLPWKNIAEVFHALLGKEYSVPALQMRYGRLRRRRLLDFSDPDQAMLVEAYEYWRTNKWHIIADKMKELTPGGEWTPRTTANAWRKLEQDRKNRDSHDNS